MEEILKAIKQLEEKFDMKFDGLEEKFDVLEERFDKVTTQLDRMETTINNVAQTPGDDTFAILKRIDSNTKNINQDIEFLSELTGKHELYFNRIDKN